MKQEPIRAGAACADTVIRLDLSSQMPPVGDQGSEGSCVAFATAYNHMTHNRWVETHGSVSNPENQCSPSFVYNQVDGGVDWGTSGGAAMDLIIQQGVSNIVDCPYIMGNYTSWPSESAYSHALTCRGDAGFWIWARDTAGWRAIKQHLVNGYTSCLGLSVYANFDNIQNFNYTYCAADRYGSNRGGHELTIVGFDDTMTTHDGQGAFKLVNSWGTGWGLSGYFWMSYQALSDTCLCSGYAYYLQDRIDCKPTMVARVKLTHPTRERIGLRLGVGPTRSPLWFTDFRRFRWTGSDQPFPTNNIVFDLSGGEQFITAGLTDTVFIRCLDDTADGNSGTIDYLSTQQLPSGRTVISPDAPESIPDARTPAYARCVLGSPGAGTCLAYDDGVVAGGWAWYAKNAGWGAIFTPPAYPARITGASARFWDRSWPVPGGDRTVIRVLAADGPDSAPGTVLYESDTLHGIRGDWKYFPLPESAIATITHGHFYIFFLQADTFPDCFGTCVDDNGCSDPNRWWASGDTTYWPADTSMHADYLIRAFVTGPTGAVQELTPTGPIPAAVRLGPAIPNPFSSATMISFFLPEAANVKLNLFDPSGRLVRELSQGYQPAGSHALKLSAKGLKLSTGVYILRLEDMTEDRTVVRKLVVR